MLSDLANSEGPVSAGASCFFIVHEATTAANASSTPLRKMNCFISAFPLCRALSRSGRVGKVSKVHREMADDTHLVPRQVAAVERDLGHRRDDREVVGQRAERRLCLGDVAHELEGG